MLLDAINMLKKNMYPTDLHYYHDLETQPEVMCTGGSCIVNPFGKYVAGPVFGREEIIYANLDPDQVVQSRLDFDVVGHCSRPDVFMLVVKDSTGSWLQRGILSPTEA